MNGLPYYKAYPRDFIEGTIGMPFELKGAYRLLLDLIYMQGGRLPDDAKYISGLLGCSTRAWNNYRTALLSMGKISAENGIISNFRADKELESLTSFQDKQREKASKPRKNNELDLAAAQPKPSHTDTDTEREEREPNGSPKKIARGSRIDDAWQLPKSWADEAVEKGLQLGMVMREAQRFKNYWLGVPGQKGVKLDWRATWRNWIDKRLDEVQPNSAPQSNFWTGKALV